MDQIRIDPKNQYACLLDVCGFLLDIDRPNRRNRLTNAAKGSSLPHLGRSLQRDGAPFPTKGSKRQKSITLPVIASSAELVGIIRELKAHYSGSVSVFRGNNQAATIFAGLSERSDEFVANFHTAFPSLWVECDIRKLYKVTHSHASSGMPDADRQAAGLHLQTQRETQVSHTFVCWIIQIIYTCNYGFNIQL